MLIKAAIVSALLLSGCANGGWTREDTYRQAAFVTLASVDWMQTRKIADNPDKYSETNPVLGKHPSRDDVNAWFGMGILAHTAVAMALPPKYREWWQYGWIAIEGAYVGNNLAIGLGFGF